MALQLKTFIRGRINNVVFLERAGTYMARSLPDKVNLSAATKVCNGNFGMASTCGKNLRGLLQPVLPNPKDRIMQVKFSGAIAEWLGSGNTALLPPTNAVPFVQEYSFNKETSIAERWKLRLTVEQPEANVIALQVPAFVPTQCITAPAHTVMIECTITTAGSLLRDDSPTGSHTVTITIPYNNTPVDAQVITLPVSSPAGTLLVTAVALRYRLANGGYCSKPAFLPASVIDARYC